MNVSKIKISQNFIILCSLFIILTLIRIISGFNGLYGQDSYEYLRFSQRFTEFFTSGKPPGDYFWPVNFPMLGAVLSLVIKDNIFALQLISMLSFVLTIFYTFQLIRLFYPNSDNEVYLYLFIFAVLSPFLFQSAFLVMSDMLAVFLTTAAIFHIIRYRHEFSRIDFFLAIFFAASAVMTRYADAVVLLFPGILLAISFYKKFRIIDLLMALLILILCLSPQLLIKGNNAGEFLGQKWLGFWSVKNWFLLEFRTIDGHQKYRFLNIIYSWSNFFYPGFFFAGVFLVFFINRKIFQNITFWGIILTIAIYALFISGFPTQNMRFLLQTFPLLILLMFPFFQSFRYKILARNGLLWSFAAFIILVQIALIYKYSLGIYRTNYIEGEIARTVLTYPNRPIYTFAIDGALKCYGVDSNNIVNMWHSQIDTVEISALVLFNEQKFKQQWKDNDPMINWEFIRNEYKLKELKQLPNNWKLFQIIGKKN